MLTLLKRYKEHKKMPSQHRVSGERGGGMGEGGVEGLGGGRGHRSEAVWQVHGMLGKLIAGLRLQLDPALFNWP